MKNDVWVVTIDFTKMDAHVLAYTRYLSKSLKPGKIHFLYVLEELKTASYLPSEYLELGHQLVKDKELTLQHKVDKYFKDAGISYDYHVKSGSPFEEIIHFVIANSANLVVAGRKKVSSGSGVVSERLSRNLPCDFLLMTEDFKPKLEKIMVATDFSKHATMAMQRAINFHNQMEKCDIIAHHCYRVPEDYSKSGKSYEDFAHILKLNAEKEMKRWLSRFDQKIKPILTLKDDRSLARQMVDTARGNHVDLIMIGSKGQSKSSIAMMGSNTMKLIREDETIPIYIAKSKGENLKLLDVLKKG